MSLAEFAVALVSGARRTRHRQALVLAGTRESGRHAAQAILSATALAESVWITDAGPPGARILAASHARQLLGGEVDAVVFDIYAGLDVEALAVVAGTLRAGGLLLLIAPPRHQWSAFDDPEQTRITVHPVPPTSVTRRFITRFERQFDGALWVEEGKPLPSLPPSPAPAAPLRADELGCVTIDQRNAVEAIIAMAGAATPGALVLTSDRGRGKSAALGLAAAALLDGGATEIIVTAPRFDAAALVFSHAQRHLPAARRARDLVRHRDARLRFVAPDALAEARGDLLLVDEAAAIPAPLLERALDSHARVVFSTTVHGYEGSGRGFATRFQSLLDARMPAWRAVQLEQPVRWAADDPLEHLLFRALLLDGAPVDDRLAREAAPAGCRFERADRDALATDEQALAELFGLLVLAHYRTSPLDLRFLLDGPNLSVWLARHGGRIIGAALVAEEGGFDAPLARAVWEGRRRPRGHLLAQSLAVHGGIGEAPMLRYHRVVRIAIHPAAQGRGIGSALLGRIEQAARDAGIDALGSSFGAAPELLHFWARAGFTPVRLGVTKEASSGAPAAMVLRSLTPAGEALRVEARARYLDLLPHLLRDPLRDLPAPLAEALAERTLDDPPLPVALDARDWRELAAYLAGRRDLELVLGPLHRLLDADALECLDAEARDLVAMKVQAAHTWAEVVEAFGLRGRAEAQGALRAALRELILARGGATVAAELSALV